MAWSYKKIILVAGGATVGGVACFFTAGAAAPAVGYFVGSLMGLSGAAATSAGLAALGGGAIAIGGGGMAAGAALITASLAGAGTLLGALGMGTMANFFKDSSRAFEEALVDQKDYAKAQKIICQQEDKIRELQKRVAAERRNRDIDRQKIQQLEEAIAKLIKVVDCHKKELRKATS